MCGIIIAQPLARCEQGSRQRWQRHDGIKRLGSIRRLFGTRHDDAHHLLRANAHLHHLAQWQCFWPVVSEALAGSADNLEWRNFVIVHRAYYTRQEAAVQRGSPLHRYFIWVAYKNAYINLARPAQSWYDKKQTRVSCGWLMSRSCERRNAQSIGGWSCQITIKKCRIKSNS